MQRYLKYVRECVWVIYEYWILLHKGLEHLQELKLIGLDIPHFAADLPLNRCKNRYTNILPCKLINSPDPSPVS